MYECKQVFSVNLSLPIGLMVECTVVVYGSVLA